MRPEQCGRDVVDGEPEHPGNRRHVDAGALELSGDGKTFDLSVPLKDGEAKWTGKDIQIAAVRVRATADTTNAIAIREIAGAAWREARELLYQHRRRLAIGLALMSALTWALGNLFFRSARGVSMFAVTVWASVLPPIPLALASLALDGPMALAAPKNSGNNDASLNSPRRRPKIAPNS